SAYQEEPAESAKRIFGHILEEYPASDSNELRKILGIGADAKSKEKKHADKAVDYPANLFRDLSSGKNAPALDPRKITPDQVIGLEYVLGKLKEEERQVIFLRYEKGLSRKEVADVMGLTRENRVTTIRNKAFKVLRHEPYTFWYVHGFTAFQAMLDENRKGQAEAYARTHSNVTKEQLLTDLETLKLQRSQRKPLEEHNITTLIDLLQLIQDPAWYRYIRGISYTYANRIVGFLIKNHYMELNDPVLEKYPYGFRRDW
ncbi:MAG: hypothetical protein HUJ72_02580, partial [Blautia sp.]|nr:hypothetical protein [Blautia sp.]